MCFYKIRHQRIGIYVPFHKMLKICIIEHNCCSKVILTWKFVKQRGIWVYKLYIFWYLPLYTYSIFHWKQRIYSFMPLVNMLNKFKQLFMTIPYLLLWKTVIIAHHCLFSLLILSGLQWLSCGNYPSD